MAKATIENKTVTKHEEVEEKVYTLTLSEEEAKTLYALTGNVVGYVGNTYAKHTYAIRTALARHGVRTWFSVRFECDSDISARLINS